MTPSSKCVELIRGFEGLRLRLYKDVGGLWTVGYGHLVRPGDMQRFASGISTQEAINLLMADVGSIGWSVQSLTHDLPLTQNQFDALVSFAFNLGAGKLAEPSCTVLPKLKAGDTQGAMDVWVQYDHVDGRQVPGLLARRQAERALFLS